MIVCRDYYYKLGGLLMGCKGWGNKRENVGLLQY